VSGLVLVCHGRSSPKAIRNAVVAASRFVADSVLSAIERRVATVMVAPR
jgi:fatty acid/phospholipid biosynthesis enzyme